MGGRQLPDFSNLHQSFFSGGGQQNDSLIYHLANNSNELDFLLNTHDYKMVIDEKYKLYGERANSNDDIRQVSGYARLSKVYDTLKLGRKIILIVLLFILII